FTGGCRSNVNQTLPIITNYEYTGPIASMLASGTDADDYTLNLGSGGYGISVGSTSPNAASANDTVTWTIQVGNGGNTVSNAWLAKKPGISGVTITKVTQTTQWFGGTGPTPPIVINPDANGIYHLLNSAPGYWGDYYEIEAVYTNCVKDSLTLMAGYDCVGYPTNISNPALLCNYDEMTLYISPEITQLQQIITAVPSTNIDLCDTVAYQIAVSSVQIGTVENITTSFVMSPGYLLSVVPNTSEVEYPNGSGTWVTIPNPTITGSTATWDISNAPALASTLGTTGLTGVTTVPNNRFNLRFRAVTVPCSVKDGMTFLFTTVGEKPCGATIAATDQITAPLHLNGAISPANSYDVEVTATNAEPCNGNASVLRFCAKNLGAGLSNTSEFIELSVYTGGTSTGTPTNIHNGGVSLLSTTSVPGGVNFRYQMPAGVAVGDSVVFSIPVTVNASLSCDTTRVRVEGSVNLSFNAVCSTNPAITCNLGQILGQGDEFITVDRPKIGVAVNGFSASSVLNPPNGETLTASLIVTNTGTLAITAANPFSVSFYHDADMNGEISAGDQLLGTQNVSANIAPAATHNVIFTQNITGGKICPLMAVLDYTPCYCSDTSVVLTDVPVNPATFNLTLCPGVTSSPLGSAAITGYTYSWTSAQSGATAYLSGANIANPTFTKNTNTSGGVETFVYTLYIDRGQGCIATQVITINVDTPSNCPQYVGSVGNYVWNDANTNGLQDEAVNLGINGVSVQLWIPGPDNLAGTSDDTLKQTVITANDGSGNAGYYLFSNLYTSNYFVVFPATIPNYMGLTTPTLTAATNGNSDANVSTGRSPIFNINVTGTGVAKDNITIDAGYTPCVLVASIAKSNDLSCPTPTATLTASPATGVSYLWDNGSTNSTRVVSAAGTYSVTVTNTTNGCSGSANVTVNSTISVPPCVPITIQKTK
ncbi:MAG: SdrD B-like domain-containing protein, partial [Bacteroidia bacterium]